MYRFYALFILGTAHYIRSMPTYQIALNILLHNRPTLCILRTSTVFLKRLRPQGTVTEIQRIAYENTYAITCEEPHIPVENKVIDNNTWHYVFPKLRQLHIHGPYTVLSAYYDKNDARNNDSIEKFILNSRGELINID